MARPWLILTIVCIAGAAARAQDAGVELRLGTYTLEPGEAIDVQLVCTNTGRPDAPTSAMPDGLKLELAGTSPSVFAQTSILQGRRTQVTTYTWPMRLTALKEGTYTLGPLTVSAEGRTWQTDPVEVVVRASQITSLPRGDQVMFAEIEVAPTTVYLTQSYTTTLTIGMRKVNIEGRTYNIDLLRDVLSVRESQLSVFAGGQVSKSEQRIRDSAGHTHAYEVFRVTKSIRADEPGDALVGPVFLRANYPLRLRRGFFGDLEVAESRRETTRADAVTVLVKAPPAEGRPPSYTGSIGEYAMAVDAKPLRVEQGQPITLTVTITGVPLESVAGPDLTQQPELAGRFDFATEELVGDVVRESKVFHRAIFPRQQGAQSIPSIAWSYFDPRRQSYVTLSTDPIDIVVDPPVSGGDSHLVDHASERATGLALTRLAGGIAPNHVNPEVVLVDQAPRFEAAELGAVAGAPVAYLLILLTARHRSRMRRDPAWARRRGARARAERLLRDGAAKSDAAEGWQRLARALTGYVCDRFDLPPGRMTPGEIGEVLAANGLNADLVSEVRGFLESCDAVRYAPGAQDSAALSDATARTRQWIEKLEQAVRRT